MIVDQVDAEIQHLQQQAESLMVTPCTITRPSTVSTEPATGADVEVLGAMVYDGSAGSPGCKLQTRLGQVRTVESGSGTVAVDGLEVHVPVGSGPYRIGDLVRILDQPQGSELRRFRVAGLHLKTWQTAQRLPVDENPGVVS